jgi:hypothetical protein
MNKALWIALAGTSVAIVQLGCLVDETCDPELEDCEEVDAGGGGSDTISTGEDCGDLAEGASQCVDGDTVELCDNGELFELDCGAGTFCDAGECSAPIRYVYIYDLSSSLSGQHPGVDIDGISLVSEGRTYYAEVVTDVESDDSVENGAPNPDELLGEPESGASGTCDLDSDPAHWYSLAGGHVVISFDGGRAIRDGDQVIVHECTGSGAREPYGFSIGVGSTAGAADGWFGVAEEAQGTVSVTVDYAELGLR